MTHSPPGRLGMTWILTRRRLRRELLRTERSDATNGALLALLLQEQGRYTFPPPGAVEPRGFLDEWCRLFAGAMLQKTVEDSAALETFGLMEALR